MHRARADFIEPAFEEHNQPTQEELTKVVKTFWIKRNLPPRNASDHNNMGTGYFKNNPRTKFSLATIFNLNFWSPVQTWFYFYHFNIFQFLFCSNGKKSIQTPDL
jgi:hypothetical protein